MILNAFTAVAKLDLRWILVWITCILEVVSYIYKFQSEARKLRTSIETQTNIIIFSW